MERPLCDACGKRPATVYIQVIGPDVQQSQRLCPECATEHEIDALPFTLAISPGGDVDISVRHTDLGADTALPADLPDERCPECGMSSSEVASDGLAGCPECYENLRQTVAGLVATIQPGHPEVPAPAEEPLPELSPLARLQFQLAEAVGDEEYERAAKLRDEIVQASLKSARH
jgi:protein arginine kinase activator